VCDGAPLRPTSPQLDRGDAEPSRVAPLGELPSDGEGGGGEEGFQKATMASFFLGGGQIRGPAGGFGTAEERRRRLAGMPVCSFSNLMSLT